MKKSILGAVLTVALLFCVGASAQTPKVSRFDAFGGFSYLAAPKMNLYQRGFNGQTGVNLNRWLALGFDYSVFTGSSVLSPSELTDEHQAELAPYAPMLPPGFAVPFDAKTSTYTAGPQVSIRKWKPVTFFLRPAVGILHETVTARPKDAISTAIVVGLVGPTQKKSDTTLFYGVGGGFDLNLSDRIAWRMAADFVHVNLFDTVLREGRNCVRLSVGPTFRWGRNVQ